MYQEITNIVKEIVGHEYLYMDSAIVVKFSPHQPALRIWALCVSPAGDLYVMDGNESWHQVDTNDFLLIGSVYQRAQAIQKTYIGAVIPEPVNA